MDSVWDEITKNWAFSFYTEPVMILMLLFAFVLSVIYIGKSKYGFLFTAYFLIYLIHFISSDIYKLGIFKLIPQHYQIRLIIIDCIIEIISFGIFFYNSGLRPSLRKIIKITIIPLTLFSMLYFVVAILLGKKPEFFEKSWYIISSIELIFFFFYCLLYYYNILFSDSTLFNMYKRPSFWICSTITLLCIVKIPIHPLQFELTRSDIQLQRVVYTTEIVVYSLVILSLIYSYLCKKAIIT